MRSHFAHDVAAAYGAATHAETATCADLARIIAEAPVAYLGNPMALARRLAAAGLGDDFAILGFYDNETRQAALRDFLRPLCRDFARFTRMQLALPLPCPFTPDSEADMSTNERLPSPVLNDRDCDDGKDRPCAAPGLISYRLRGPYGFVMIGALDNTDAMRSAARSFSHGTPDRAALEVYCDEAGAYVPAPLDDSEGAAVTVSAFWRRYAAEAARLYEIGTYQRPHNAPAAVTSPRALGVLLAQRMRKAVAKDAADMTGEAMRLTLKACGCPARSRRDRTAFIKGLPNG